MFGGLGLNSGGQFIWQTDTVNVFDGSGTIKTETTATIPEDLSYSCMVEDGTYAYLIGEVF